MERMGEMEAEESNASVYSKNYAGIRTRDKREVIGGKSMVHDPQLA